MNSASMGVTKRYAEYQEVKNGENFKAPGQLVYSSWGSIFGTDKWYTLEGRECRPGL